MINVGRMTEEQLTKGTGKRKEEDETKEREQGE
jgi:hypothetical protein